MRTAVPDAVVAPTVRSHLALCIIVATIGHLIGANAMEDLESELDAAINWAANWEHERHSHVDRLEAQRLFEIGAMW